MKKVSYIFVMVLALGLMAFSQPEWIEYSGNPIFGEAVGGPKAYYPSILYNKDGFAGQLSNLKYLMWYGTSGEQTGLAVSEDGLIWADLGVVMTDGYHATVEYFPDGFAGTNSGSNPSNITMYYRMWYWDVWNLYNVSAIGYCESPDGTNWYNYQSCQNGTVPIVSGGDPWWNRGSYGPCDVLYNPSASNSGTDWTFTMYYDGTTGGDEAIGLGFSSDGITWTGYDADSDGKADPILSGTYNLGDWDYNYASRATIIKNDDGTYEMWYSGGIWSMNHGIGYATSPDGINWTRDPNNPIFHKDDIDYPNYPWRNSRTYCPMVIKFGNLYKMWFAGKGEGGYSIGYATAAPPIIEVDIDIKPGSDPNSINLKSKGVVPVAVLTTEDFDASNINPATVLFASASPLRWNMEDVDGDGDLDMIFHFNTQELNLDENSTEACLTGQTTDGQSIHGCDSVNIVPKGKK